MANPEMMKAMIKSNPMTAQLLQQHPEMEYMLTNPEIMRSAMSRESLEMAAGMADRMSHLPSGATMSGAPGSMPMPGSPTGAPASTTQPPPPPATATQSKLYI